jgi:hypothetical protein
MDGSMYTDEWMECMNEQVVSDNAKTQMKVRVCKGPGMRSGSFESMNECLNASIYATRTKSTMCVNQIEETKLYMQ